MSKLLFWIIAVPLAAALIVFSVNNRTDVVLDLWPLALETPPLPVFAIVLTALFVGFITGGVASWLAQGDNRRAHREARRRAKTAAGELEKAERQIRRLESDAAEARARPVAASQDENTDESGDIPPPRLPGIGL